MGLYITSKDESICLFASAVLDEVEGTRVAETSTVEKKLESIIRACKPLLKSSLGGLSQFAVLATYYCNFLSFS